MANEFSSFVLSLRLCVSVSELIKLEVFMPKTILEVIDLKKHFTHRKGLFSAFKEKQQSIPAVDGVSFYLKENETVGLVGESGCGKTTIGRTILRLEPADVGQDRLRRQGYHRHAGRRAAAAAGPDADDLPGPGCGPESRRCASGRSCREAHHGAPPAGRSRRGQAHRRAARAGESQEEQALQFPHELSGGEKRRVGMARVLSVGARFIVADEPRAPSMSRSRRRS